MQPLRTIAAAAAAARQWLRIHFVRRTAPLGGRGSVEEESYPITSQVGISIPTENQQEQLEPVVDWPALPDSRLNDHDNDENNDQEEAAQDDDERACILRLLQSRRDGEPLGKLLHGRAPSSCQVVGDVLQSLDNPELALEFFNWALATSQAIGRDTLAINCLLFTLVRLGRSSQAYNVFLSSASPANSFSISVLVYGLSQAGSLDEALSLLNEYTKDAEPYPRVVNSFLQSLCDAGRLDDALDVARRRQPADPCSYSILITALCKLRRPAQAKSLFTELVTSGGCPDATAYGALMAALCKAGRLTAAMALLEDMTIREVPANVVVLTTLIDGLCKAGKLEEATSLVNSMSEGRRGSPPPNVVTYTALVDGLCKAGAIERAWSLLREMASKGCSPNVVTYSCIVDALCKARRVDEASAWLDEMVNTGVEPDAVTYTSLVHGYCLARRIDEAAMVISTMGERGVPPVHATYSAMVVGCLRARELRQAYVFLRQMLERGSACNLAAYLVLIYGFCEAGCGGSGAAKAGGGCCAPDEVGALFRLLAATVVSPGVMVVAEEMYDSTIKLERAEQVLEAMNDRGCIPGGDESQLYAALRSILGTIKGVKEPQLKQLPSEEEAFGI